MDIAPAAARLSSASRLIGRGRRAWRLRSSSLAGKLDGIGLSPLVSRVLENRGLASKTDVALFLGGRERPARDPFLIPGFDAAVQRLRQAARDSEAVCVFGDFDVDGITSTATLVETLNDLGARAFPYLPHREREGYGLNLGAVETIAARGARILVTCDCGTSNPEEVARARVLGVEVIVVDHHSIPVRLPEATLVNPKLPQSRYPFSEYATAGLAYRLAGALYEACGRSFPSERYLDLAALGTVADMVPLVDENRDIVRAGLEALSSTTRPGLQALMEVSGVQPKVVSSENISFGLAPRLNAAGRLDDARLALDLLLTRDEGEARALATRIDDLNRERQRLTREAQELAIEMTAGLDLPLTLVGHQGFHQGIVGLVASRLVETLGRPAVVYQMGETESRASCRSIAEYDVVGGLRSCADLFERFGGHRQAGGFTIRNERLSELRERLVAHAADALAGVDLTPAVEVDAEWPLGSLRAAEIRWLGRLQPHGKGNEEAVFLSRAVTAVESGVVGEDGQHLRLKLRDGPVTWGAIAFGWGDEAPSPGTAVDIVYSLSSGRFGPTYAGSGGALQLQLLDLAPSS